MVQHKKLINWYQYLDLPKGASLVDVKRQFRKLSKKYHPDVNHTPEAQTKYEQVQIAYQHLNNPQHKAQYDLSLKSLLPLNTSESIDEAGGWSGFEMFSFSKDFDEINNINAPTKVIQL